MLKEKRMEQLPEKYVTVAQEAHVEFEEKRSLFIGHAIHVDTEEEALDFIKQIKKKYSDATHNCFAYLLKGGILARYSDVSRTSLDIYRYIRGLHPEVTYTLLPVLKYQLSSRLLDCGTLISCRLEARIHALSEPSLW